MALCSIGPRQSTAPPSSMKYPIEIVFRLWATGGMEWRRSFALASENLEGVMEARTMGIAAGIAAKGGVKVIIMVTLVVIVIMARNPVFSKSIDQPLIQVVYAFAIIMMIFGYGFMGNMIERLM